MKTIVYQKFILFLLLQILTSCNSVFYQPDRREFITPEKVEVSFGRKEVISSDGTHIKLWHMKPGPDFSRKTAKGVLVQFHGNAENMSTHFLSAVWLTAVGYHVIAFDYRGYGQSEDLPPNRASCVEDSRAVLEWVSGQSDLQNLPLFVLGQSLGGAIAIPTLAKYPQPKLRGIILDSTFSSYRKIARAKLGSFWLTWPLQWPLSFLISDELSPEDNGPFIKSSTLSVHAINDPVVPYFLGRELFDSISAKDKLFWDVDLGGHTAAFAVENSKYRDMLVDWLNSKS